MTTSTAVLAAPERRCQSKRYSSSICKIELLRGFPRGPWPLGRRFGGGASKKFGGRVSKEFGGGASKEFGGGASKEFGGGASKEFGGGAFSKNLDINGVLW